ncbi:hypothetical protein ACV34M_31070, partial [Pseudomonas aeruginosa]
ARLMLSFSLGPLVVSLQHLLLFLALGAALLGGWLAPLSAVTSSRSRSGPEGEERRARRLTGEVDAGGFLAHWQAPRERG